MKDKPHGRDLRKGRFSEPSRIYHVTATTVERRPVFADFHSARVLINALRQESERGRAHTMAFVVMPDHLHWLMQLEKGVLSQVVGAVKSVCAHRLGQQVWQAGFYDHALRAEEDVLATAPYVIANPLRAGLVDAIADYPHWDAIWL
jgi:putative transposase